MEERTVDMERKTFGYGKKELWIWNERPVNIARKTSEKGTKDPLK